MKSLKRFGLAAMTAAMIIIVAGCKPAAESTEVPEPAHVHSWDAGTVTTPATCTDGVKTFICSTCGEKKTEVIPAVHSWDAGTVTKAETCTEDGVKTFTCSACSKTKTEAIPAKGHVFGDWEDAGSHKKTKTCSVCNEEESAYFYDASSVNDIGSLTESTIVIIEGEISDTNISTIKTQLKTLSSNPSVKVGLDLSATTGLTSIGDLAFYGCSSLTIVTIPSSVTSIGNNAFYNCDSLTSVTIPESVTSIGNYAFGGCTSLTSVTIPSSVTSIGNNAFGGCTSLTSVTIPESVTSIGDNAFGRCSSLKFTVDGANQNYKASDDGVMLLSKDGTKLLAAPSASGAVIIPAGVTSIGDHAFILCTSLTSVTIPSGVTSIGDYAFQGCDSLTSVTIPSSVTSIGNNAFEYCRSLESVTIPASVTSIKSSAFGSSSLKFTVDGENQNYKASDDGVMLLSKDGKTLVTAPSASGAVTIPDGVTSIESYAFEYCRSLESVTIPASVTSIGYAAFYGCSNLNSVTFNDPSNWYLYDYDSGNSGETEITDFTDAATKLTSSEWCYKSLSKKREPTS